MVKWLVVVILGMIGVFFTPNLSQGAISPWILEVILFVVLLSFFPYWLRKKIPSNDNKVPSISFKYFLIQFVVASFILVPMLIGANSFCFDRAFGGCSNLFRDTGFYLEIVKKVILAFVGVIILSKIVSKILFFVRNQLIASFIVGLLNFGAWVLLVVWWF